MGYNFTILVPLWSSLIELARPAIFTRWRAQLYKNHAHRILINAHLLRLHAHAEIMAEGSAGMDDYQRALVDEFIGVTGTDEERATFFLQSAAWNLQVIFNFQQILFTP